MVKHKCSNCDKDLLVYPSRLKKTKTLFCNKSCHRQHKNKINNPSWTRDLSGENNPMFGKHPVAWNKGLKGELCFNWKGGVHKRNDGYVRINVQGKRHLLHRYILKDKLKDTNVVHHKDSNPSNNSLSNLLILESQAEHARLHAIKS